MDLPEKLLDKMTSEKEFKDIDLPPSNTLLPKNMDIIEKDNEFSAFPHLIKQWGDNGELWFMKDNQFKLPKSQISLKI